MSTALLGDVSDTARWVAYYRAIESERADALFRDPLARRLAGDRGRVMAERLAKLALPWAIAVRTRVYDELITAALEQDAATAVVNIAAGMDARPYRLQLPRSLYWLELDLPPIVQAKAALLGAEAPCCELERQGLDVNDTRALDEVLARVAAAHRSVVVITEGLLAYLDEASVRGLARSLHAQPAIRSWVLEAALPEVIARNQRAWGEQLERAGAAMRFGPANGVDYFGAHGWRVRSRRSCLLEARRLGREPRFAGLLHFAKSLTPAGRRWLRDVVVYAVVERADG